ncbi:MAG: sulfatase-like hydrolase/transferase [Chloroflexota bacterium]
MANKAPQPNILFIMDDQHRFDYLGCAGADFVRTPNIDALAARGTRFTHCTVNSPICAPSRIALASGLMAHRVAPFDNDSYLSNRVPTYYQQLRDHGYRVGTVGKLDLGKPDKYNGRNGDRPVAYSWGFTHPHETEGKMHAARFGEPQGPYGFMLKERDLYKTFSDDYIERFVSGRGGDSVHRWIETHSHDSPLPTDAFEDIYIGQHAAQWIENVPDDFPWHYFVSFVGPHDPFDPPTEYADRWRNAEIPPAIPYDVTDRPAWIAKQSAERESTNTDMVRRQYCALIELIDEQIGQILAALEKRGTMENTIIIFASDHGEMLGDHGMYQKSVAYEQALRVPLIVAGPGIPEDVESNALIALFDINPTICEMAGVPVLENIDARSLLPLLQGETDEHRDATISSMRNFRSIRTHTHKFIENYNDRNELYDLQNDPDEMQNLVNEETELALSLRQQLAMGMKEGHWLR